MRDSNLATIDVSRETLEDFRAFEALVIKWSKKINLVSKRSSQEVFSRHIADSAQLWPLTRNFEHLVDFGSGGGFPGLVLAICEKHTRPEKPITLVESDLRKSVFLQTVTRELQLNVQVLTKRIETLPPMAAAAITARALASCDRLFEYAAPHLRPGGKLFLLKGEKAEEEIADARHRWHFSVKKHQSYTNPRAVVLEIGDLARV